MKKIFNTYEIKNIALSVKDIDTVGRRVRIALASFDTIDSDRDLIRKGAFTKSLQERGVHSQSNRKIAFLRYHDWEHQIGKFVSLEETDTHLIGDVEMGRSTKGEDAFLDYQDGLIREHSIGYNYLQDKIQLMGEGDKAYYDIKEVFLWEGSAVTFGSNSLTPTLDVSKGNHTEVLAKVNEEMQNLIAALKHGKGTDERLYSLEMAFKVCQQKYNSLLTSQPVAITTKEKPNEEATAEAIKEAMKKQYFINLLK